MKIFSSIILLVLIFQISACGDGKTKHLEENTIVEETAKGKAEIVFDTIVNDMGMIREGEKVIAWFEYENKGDGPLLINSINAGCGCTVPNWNKKPLNPGESESVKVVFDSAGKKGLQDIRITVHSNAKNAQEELRLKASVKRVN